MVPGDDDNKKAGRKALSKGTIELQDAKRTLEEDRLQNDLDALYKAMQRPEVAEEFKRLQRTPPRLNPDVIYRNDNDEQNHK